MKSIGPLLNRRRFAASVLMGGLSLPLAAEVQSEIARESLTEDPSLTNPLLWAVAWANTSAEFGALCHQAYNLATLRVALALEKRSTLGKDQRLVVCNTCNLGCILNGYIPFRS
jgi:predicted secreted acid phosphatase